MVFITCIEQITKLLKEILIPGAGLKIRFFRTFISGFNYSKFIKTDQRIYRM